jgi:hypothetical protein
MNTLLSYDFSIPIKAAKVLPALNAMEKGWNIFTFYNDTRSSIIIERFRQEMEISINKHLLEVKLYRRFEKLQLQSLGKNQHERSIIEQFFPGLYSKPNWPKVYVVSNNGHDIHTIMSSHGLIDQRTEEAVLHYVIQLSHAGY